jgi:uncharacterized protein (DUF2252 family)
MKCSSFLQKSSPLSQGKSNKIEADKTALLCFAISNIEGVHHGLSPGISAPESHNKTPGRKFSLVRELMPQDRKIEVEQLTSEDAIAVAGFLAAVMGKAHGRQMDTGTRKEWQRELHRSRSKSLNAPSWLWTSLVELLADHERAYLDHCRQWALESA